MRRCAAIGKQSKQNRDRPFEWRPIPVAIGVLLVVLSIWAYFRYRHIIEHAVHAIQAFGPLGIVIDICLMALLCIIPLPSEFFIVLNMTVYGVGWGLLYAWLGAISGAVAAMYLTRWAGQNWIRPLLPEERLSQVDTWVKRNGTVGLLTLRFVPFVPYHAANYVAGLLPIRVWPFIWTTGLGLVPYFLGMMAFGLGLSTNGLVPAIVIGLTLFAFLGVSSYVFRKKWLAAFSVEAESDEPGDRSPGIPRE